MYFQAFILGFAIGIPQGVAAGVVIPPLSVTTAERILEHAKVCKDNELFVTYAKKTRDDFELLVSRSKAELAKNFSGKTSSSQKTKINDSIHDYSVSLDGLDSLIRRNRDAIRVLDEYLQNLVMPFDVRNVMNVPCFGDSANSIREYAGDLRDDLADLFETRSVAAGNRARSRHDSNFLVAQDAPVRQVGGRQAASAPASSLSRIPKQRGSDITGTQPEKNFHSK